MEPTMNASGGKSSKLIIWVIVVILIIAGIMFAMKSKTEAPVSENTLGDNPTNSQLEASVNGALNFDNEASLSEIDQEFQ